MLYKHFRDQNHRRPAARSHKANRHFASVFNGQRAAGSSPTSNLEKNKNEPNVSLSCLSALLPWATLVIVIILTVYLRHASNRALAPLLLFYVFPFLGLAASVAAIVIRINSPSPKVKSAALCFLMSWSLIFAAATGFWGALFVCLLLWALNVFERRFSLSENPAK